MKDKDFIEKINETLKRREATYDEICFYHPNMAPVVYDTRTTCDKIILAENGSWVKIIMQNDTDYEIWENIPYVFSRKAVKP